MKTRAFALTSSSKLRQIEEALGLNPVARARLGKHAPPSAPSAARRAVPARRPARLRLDAAVGEDAPADVPVGVDVGGGKVAEGLGMR
ncbi:MAG: hypothetical protein OXO50_18350 [Caldilineaceae bacterium]|nr:hypothetical protein [Caldilineaceae bacterium]